MSRCLGGRGEVACQQVSRGEGRGGRWRVSSCLRVRAGGGGEDEEDLPGRRLEPW